MRIALTFDAEHPDRPHCPPGVAERIITTLRKARVQATFFLQGRWVEAYPHIARDMAGGGHRIASHSFYHARLAMLSDEGLIRDIGAAEQVIEAVTGVDPKPWFRCPWGESGSDARILRVLADLGYRHVGWHVRAGEWEIDRTPREVEDAVVSGVLSVGENAIILLHAWPVSVPATLPAIIRRLREAGGEFVTLDDLDPASLPVSPEAQQEGARTAE
jgi:peptidoglycan/xylan/chitin deacetylase (PgdA/CDA1 family)